MEKRSVPWVVIFFAVANVAVFGWALASGASPTRPSATWMFEHGGNYGPVTLDGEQWRLVTSMFLHYGVLHIVMNLIGLLDGGRHVERMYGPWGFAALYIVSGLAGSLASAIGARGVSAGASGAVFGVFGAFAAFLVLHRERLNAEMVKKQTKGLVIFVVINTWLGLSVKGIDIVAHAGGFVTGFLIGLALEIGTHEDQSTTRRSLVVGLIGAALAIGASFVVPKSSNPAVSFALAEQAVIDRWNAMVPAINGGKLADGEIADQIEKKILGPWHAARATHDPDRLRTSAVSQMREQGWTMMVEGLRKQDAELVRKGTSHLKNAENLLSVSKDLRK